MTNNIHNSPSLNNLLEFIQSGKTVALTAPLVLDQQVFIGVADTPENPSCLKFPLEEFQKDLYCCTSASIAVHGLNRIWEYLDELNLLPDNPPVIPHLHDTKLMAYLLDPDSARSEKSETSSKEPEGLTLAYLAGRYLGENYPYKVADIYESGSPDLLADMLALDARVIFNLAQVLARRMPPHLMRLYRELELPFMVLLNDMRRVGIGFDGFRCMEEMNRTERSMAVLAQEITGGQSVDLTSHEQVYQLLVSRGVPLNLNPAYVRRKGIQKHLEQIAPAYSVVRQVLEWWDMGLELGFLRKWAGHTRMHPVWGQTRSTTSRVYARSPAVQNISRKLRHLFIPRKGYLLIKADYSQAQMRILAHLSGDPELVRVFNDPTGDVHTETSLCLGLNDRSVAKEINFAICFGMGKESLCATINELKEQQGRTDLINPDTAQSYIDGFYARYPRVREFFADEWKKMTKLPQKDRVVRSLLGRERHFSGRPSAPMERQFRVTWPQQIEADLMKTAMVRLDRIFRRRNMKARIVMMVHDALWVEAPLEEENEVRHLVERMMTTARKLDVPLGIDFE
jgi:DNA polymerase I